MPNLDTMKEFYKECKAMDIEDTMEIVLNAESEEEQEFYETIFNYILKEKQKQVVA